jgi:hypothetical protein
LTGWMSKRGEGWMTSSNLLESTKQLMQKLELESEEVKIAEETLEGLTELLEKVVKQLEIERKE